MILAVAVIAVCAIAIIGVGYAYTATTENTGNDSSVKYITLTQGKNSTAAEAAATYANAFDKEITYDTKTAVVGNIVTTTYTLTAGQAVDPAPITGLSLVKLGEVQINTSKVNTKDGFKFFVTNGDTMTGTFYIGIDVGTDKTLREYTSKANNYYKTGTDNGAVTEDTATSNVTVISSGSATVDTITVSMYYSAPAEPPASPNNKPLQDVTFTFTAVAVEPTPTP